MFNVYGIHLFFLKKIWNFNMLNDILMEKLIEDFPCWKAKFTVNLNFINYQVLNCF
jgi:hypothetical protein